jgi:peptidoglycan/xylan/chitin deacetylase (PgdA/CDA1 family)
MQQILDAYYVALEGFGERIKNELSILLYHGVSNLIPKGIENASNKHISQNAFHKQMSYIKKHCNLLSMDDVLECLCIGKFPEKSVAITFDDGFKNNYSVAAPILDELQLPATFYFCSGIINTDRMFWVDEIEDCINRSKVKHIDISLGNRIQKFSLENNNSKLEALIKIKDYCKKQGSDITSVLIKELQGKTQIVPSVESSDNYKKMNWKEVCEMDRNKLFIIGGHSMYHDILTALSDEQMREDVETSIEVMENKLGHKITHYSYPEGQKHHYSNKVISVLKSKGIKCSPSAVCGLNDVTENPFHLKRIMVGFSGLPFPYWEQSLNPQ